MRRVALSAAIFAWAVGAASAQTTFETGKVALKNVPLRVPHAGPAPEGGLSLEVNGKRYPAQVAEPRFGSETKTVVAVVDELPAGAPVSAKVVPGSDASGTFAWKETPGEHTDLHYVIGGKATPILRYMHKTYDPSSKDARNKSYKVFHHLYNPSGTRIVTNGGHTDEYKNEKDLLFPHHRGLMFAFNRVSYGEKKTADTWHCTGDAHVTHEKTLFATAGPTVAEHRVLLHWHGPKNEVFAAEERQMTVYRTAGGTLVEFATRLTSKVGKVRLDGDPQHAGFQFRAHNDVAAKTKAQTYYLRPDGKGEMGATRNWDAKTRSALSVNLPWNVLSFVLDGKRYSVEYVDHPSNPGEKRYSERDYARFGCYFEFDLDTTRPLLLNHRVWLQEGEMTREQAEAIRSAFVDVRPTTR